MIDDDDDENEDWRELSQNVQKTRAVYEKGETVVSGGGGILSIADGRRGRRNLSMQDTPRFAIVQEKSRTMENRTVQLRMEEDRVERMKDEGRRRRKKKENGEWEGTGRESEAVGV